MGASDHTNVSTQRSLLPSFDHAINYIMRLIVMAIVQVIKVTKQKMFSNKLDDRMVPITQAIAY